jgi:hypothetical protein
MQPTAVTDCVAGLCAKFSRILLDDRLITF